MGAQSFKDEYFVLLKKHFEQPSETHLLAAAELGKSLLQSDVPTETVAEIHQQALHRLATLFPQTMLVEAVQLVSEPLMELLMAYGLASRKREASRRHAETAQLQAEEKLRFAQFAVDHAADSIYWLTSDARFFYVNNAACRALGYSREELLAMSVHDIDPDFPAEGWPDTWKETRRQGATTIESHHRRKDGHVFPVEILSNPIEFEGKELNCAFVRDISAREQAEDQIRQHQDQLAQLCRLSTIGELAAGLAHELNQPLAAITIYSSACLTLLHSQVPCPEIEQTIEMLDKLEAQSLRAGGIIQRLRNLVAKREPESLPFRLNDAVRNVEVLIGSEFRIHGISLKLELDDRLPDVRGDAIQIEQVVLNLMRNSFDAMLESPGQQPELTVRTSQPGENEIEVTFRDTGPGIPLEKQNQVFEALFSTKSSGLGLGLPISKSIVQAHQGHLSFQPNPDRGVTFRLALPLHTGEPQ